VYNGDFEMYDTCPNNISYPNDLQIEHCLGWTAPTKLGTSDYFNVCNNATSFKIAGVPKNFFGYQQAYNGNAYCGFYACVVDSFNNQPVIYREYLQTKLQFRLEKNRNYQFSFYLSASSDNTHSLIKVGALFSSLNYIANTFAPIFAKPQVSNTTQFLADTLNWMKVEGTFVADGTEDYLTIGYFETGNADTLNNHYDPFKPYYVVSSYYYVDGVSLIELPCVVNLPNVFTPNDDGINDEFMVQLCDSTQTELTIYNRWGNKVFETTDVNISWNGRTTSGELCSEGSYYYVVITRGKKEKGFIQLVR
jgi:gliding motility-associated-like protein